MLPNRWKFSFCCLFHYSLLLSFFCLFFLHLCTSIHESSPLTKLTVKPSWTLVSFYSISNPSPSFKTGSSWNVTWGINSLGLAGVENTEESECRRECVHIARGTLSEWMQEEDDKEDEEEVARTHLFVRVGATACVCVGVCALLFVGGEGWEGLTSPKGGSRLQWVSK